MFKQSLRSMLVGLLATAGLAVSPTASAASYSNMYVFGDSLSDSGNVFALTGGAFPPPPYAGRFSNGPTYAEDLASRLGFAANPSLLGGTNYAFGGATAAPGSNISGFPTDLGTQVGSFRSLSGPADANALYVIWSGANDLRNQPDAAGVTGALTGLQTAISDLYLEGARNFLVMNLPDLGLTPEATMNGVNAQATYLSAAYDSFFGGTIAGLRGGLAGSDIRTLDTFSLLHAVAADPLAYGLGNVSDSCLTTTSVCANPDSYLFWDAIHPTAVGHRIIADAAYNVVAVPEPETYAMLLAGLGLLGTIARRRKPA